MSENTPGDPLRVERRSVSDLNPWLSWLGPAGEVVRAQRQPADRDKLVGQAERMVSELISASLDYDKEMRDTMSEVVFFQTYGNLYSIYQAEDDEKSDAAQPAGHPCEQALETLPQLLAERADRERLLTLLDRLIVDERVTQLRSTPGNCRWCSAFERCLRRHRVTHHI